MLLFPACAASNTFCQSDDLGYKCRCYPAINQTMEFPSSPLKIKIIASKSEVQLRRFAMFPNMTSNQHAVIRVIIYMACFKVISMDTLTCVCVCVCLIGPKPSLQKVVLPTHYRTECEEIRTVVCLTFDSTDHLWPQTDAALQCAGDEGRVCLQSESEVCLGGSPPP